MLQMGPLLWADYLKQVELKVRKHMKLFDIEHDQWSI